MPRLDSFFFTLPGFYVISEKNIRLIYFLRLIRDVLNKVTLFFLPIFIFNFGGKLPWFESMQLSDIQAGMILIAIFFSIQRSVIFFSAIPLGKWMIKWNFETSLLLSYVLRVVSFACLYFASQYPLLLVAAAFFEGIQSNFFWNSFFTLLTNHIEEKSMGKELGLHRFLFQIFSVLAPAISGYLAYRYGLEVLFLLGIVLNLISAVLITGININLPQDDVSWKEFKEWLKKPSFLKATGSFAGRYINDTVLFLWPLYVFLVLGTVERVGFLYTFSLFIALVLAFFIGGFIDKISANRRPFFLSGGALSLVWLARTQIFTVWGMALADTVERVFSNFHWLFYDVLFIKRGKGTQAFSYFVYREMVISAFAILFWALVCIFFMINDSWSAVFIFAGIGVLLSLLISETFDEKKPAAGLKL
jgi:MFS family permease